MPIFYVSENREEVVLFSTTYKIEAQTIEQALELAKTNPDSLEVYAEDSEATGEECARDGVWYEVERVLAQVVLAD